MECQTHGVKWPSVTRPADSTSAPPLLSAPRSCVCGHPVYDDQEPRCPLCACQEHKPRFLTADYHSAPATVSPGTGEAWRGPPPRLSGPSRCCLCNSRPLPRKLCPRTLLASVTPATRCPRCPAVGRPGRTQPRAGATVAGSGNPSPPGIRPGCGRPRPSLPGTSISGACCRRPRGAPSFGLKRVQTEVPSGLAASSVGGSRQRHPETPCRYPVHPRR
jgi:hypothetical protein